MATNVNPDPHSEGFQWQPTNSVTAILNGVEEVNQVIHSLKQSGFSGDDISVFMGRDGLAKLDVHGENHGVAGRLIRAVESVTADQHPDKDVESALRQGRVYMTISTHGDDQKKAVAERVLKAHHADTIRHFGRWAVERL